MPDFRLQNNFPISEVINAAQQNATRQQQAQQQGQQSLIQGLQSIGQVGQSLYDQRRAQAQALAGAQYIAAKNPELFQPTTTTTQAPVAASQTASYDPSTGSVTPNTGMAGAVTTRPQTTTAPPQMDIRTMANALIGTPFNDVLKTGFEQHKLDIDTGLKLKEIQNTAQAHAGELGLQKILATITGNKAVAEATHTANEDINSLLARKAELTKSLPTNIFGWQNDQAKAASAEIADINAQLAKRGYKSAAPSSGGNANPISQKFTSNNGTNYTVNP